LFLTLRRILTSEIAVAVAVAVAVEDGWADGWMTDWMEAMEGGRWKVGGCLLRTLADEGEREEGRMMANNQRPTTYNQPPSETRTTLQTIL
jgi:hypothetical protein